MYGHCLFKLHYTFIINKKKTEIIMTENFLNELQHL